MGTLTQTPANILYQHLVNGGVFVNPAPDIDWPLYVGHLPDKDNIPDKAAAIYDTTGVLDGRLMKGPTVEHHGIQVKVRSDIYNDGYAKCTEVVDLFEAATQIVIVVDSGVFRIENVSRATSIAPLGVEDSQRRDLFTINFLATIREE